jgi:uncharacterized protein YoxC
MELEIFKLSEIIHMHQKHLVEIVAKSNQLIDNFQILNEFVNKLVDKINEMDSEIMELARKVFEDGVEESF